MIEPEIRDSNIVVTGGCGYLGYSVLRDLPDYGWQTIYVVDNLSKGHALALVDLPESANYRFVHTDILDTASTADVLSKASTVIHLASLSSNPISIGSNAAFEQINHWGTAALMDVCKRSNVKRVVYASDTCVYGEGDDVGEDTTCNPIGQYAQSMLNGEAAAKLTFGNTENLRILRVGMLHGFSPTMQFDTFINRMTFAAAIGKSIAVHGNGKQTRPAIHVTDASRAVCIAASTDCTWPELVNVVSENLSVLQLAEIIQEQSGCKIHYTGQNLLARISLSIAPNNVVSNEIGRFFAIQLSVKDILKRFGGASVTP
jgi:UDP-glucose 4-epimerase